MRTWTVEMTRERLAAMQAQLEWALQYQDHRYYVFARSPRGLRTILLVALAVAGLALAIAYACGHHGAIYGLGAVIGTMIGVSIRRLSAKPRSERVVRGTGTKLSRHAARVYASARAQAPYTIDYELRDGAVRARVPAQNIDRTTSLAMPRRVVATPEALFLFRRAWSFYPRRFIYPCDADVRRELLGEFERRGVEVIAVDGPVAGYYAPIPSVRVV